MRVLHVISTIDPDWGGPPVVATRLAAAQAAQGHQVTLMSYDGEAARRSWANDHAMLDGGSEVQMVYVPSGGRLEGLFGSNGRKVARSLMPDHDVVHVHGVWETILRVTAEEAARAGKPYLFTAHGMLGENHLKTKGLKKRIAIALKYRRLFNGAAALHMGNDVEAELSTILGLQPPMLVCPNGISFEEIEPLPEKGTFRAKFPQVGARPFILFLSRLHQVKGLDYLADAFKIFCESDDETDLVVAGPDGGMQETFEAAISAHGLDERVHVVGPLYGRDKFAAFADAECFCLPSRQEGFAIVLNETLACSLPMVITEGCNRPDIVEAEAGVMVPLDAAEIARALSELMSDAPHRRAMGANGRRHAADKLTWDAVSRTMIENYEIYRSSSTPSIR